MDNYAKKRVVIFGLFVACLFLMIMTAISVVSANSAPKREAVIINKDVAFGANSILTDNDYGKIRELALEFSNSKYERVHVGVREATYEEEEESDGTKVISFLADILETNVTYYVSITKEPGRDIDYYLDCVPARLAKNPENYCRGTESNSSIESNIGHLLPYDGTDELGRRFRLDYVGLTNKAELAVTLFSQCDDEGAPEAAMKAVKEFIRSYGMDPEQVPISIDKSACWYEHADSENDDTVLEW